MKTDRKGPNITTLLLFAGLSDDSDDADFMAIFSTQNVGAQHSKRLRRVMQDESAKRVRTVDLSSDDNMFGERCEVFCRSAEGRRFIPFMSFSVLSHVLSLSVSFISDSY